MKTCPVCSAKAFDDAEVCYGCLYRFASENKPASTLAESVPTVEPTSPVPVQSVSALAAPVRSAAPLPLVSLTSPDHTPEQSTGAQPLKASFDLPLDDRFSMRASCDVIVHFFPVAPEDNVGKHCAINVNQPPATNADQRTAVNAG